jgi:hypothetical protein
MNYTSIIRLIFIIFILFALYLILFHPYVEGMCSECSITPTFSQSQTAINNNIVSASNVFNPDLNLSGVRLQNCFFGTISGSSNPDICYTFCPWNVMPSGDCYASTDTSMCCNENDTFYTTQYLEDSCGNKLYGMLFNRISSNLIGSELNYKFKPVKSTLPLGNSSSSAKYVVNDSSTFSSLNTNIYNLPNDNYYSLSFESSGPTSRYINCSGDIITYTPSELQDKCPFTLFSTLEMSVNQVGYNDLSFKKMVNDTYSCRVNAIQSGPIDSICDPIIPQETAISQIPDEFMDYSMCTFYTSKSNGNNNQFTSQASDVVTQQIPTVAQDSIRQLTDVFTQQINNLKDSLMTNLQFPAVDTRYLNLASCNDLCYNTAEITKTAENLSQYTCYPTLTGEFQDCGPAPYMSTIDFNRY